MNGYYNGVDNSSYLAHYGVLGMKWGQHLFGKTEASRAGRKRASKKDKRAARLYIFGSAALGAYAGGIAGTVLGGMMFSGPAMALGAAAIGAISVGTMSAAAAIKETNDIYEAMSKNKTKSFDDLMKIKEGYDGRIKLSDMSTQQLMSMQDQQNQAISQQIMQQQIRDITYDNMLSQQAVNECMSLSISAATPGIPMGAMVI